MGLETIIYETGTISFGQTGPPLEVDHFFRKISTWTEAFHLCFDRNFGKFGIMESNHYVCATEHVISRGTLLTILQGQSVDRDLIEAANKSSDKHFKRGAFEHN